MLSSSFNIDNDYLDNIEAAMEQVKDIIEAIDMMQSLYPTSKSMTSENKQCGTKQYQVFMRYYRSIINQNI